MDKLLSNPDPKHRQISNDLRKRILRGNYGDEGRMPSEAQLCQRFSTSRPTVARALRTLIEEGLVTRRAGSGTFASANLSTASAIPKKHQELGLFVPDLEQTEIFQLISGEIADLARNRHYSVIWGGGVSGGKDKATLLKQAEELCLQFISRKVCGVFFAPSIRLANANARLAVQLRKAGIPVVLLDKGVTPFPERSQFDLISTDNLAAGFMLTTHLIKLGNQRIIFATGHDPAPTIMARIAGFREALIRHDLETANQPIQHGNPADKGFVTSLLSLKPDAVICGNDETAAMLLQSFAKIRVRVPKDVRVCGFDDVRFASLASPPLTTVQQPSREIALTAFQTMLERQTESALPARHISVAPTLIIRDSCGTYPHTQQGKAD